MDITTTQRIDRPSNMKQRYTNGGGRKHSESPLREPHLTSSLPNRRGNDVGEKHVLAVLYLAFSQTS